MTRYTKRKKIYTLIGILVCSLLLIIGLIIFLTRDSLKLSIKDGETIVLEYGMDSLPTVTALFWNSAFDQEGTPVRVTSTGDLDMESTGTYEITYSAKHNDLSTTATLTVVIQDTTPPVLTLEGGEVGYYSPGYTYSESGFTAIDNHDGDITDQVVRKESGDSVTYTITDSHGNSVTATRELVCQDVIPPAISLIGEPRIELSLGEEYSDSGATALDDVDGDVTAALVVSGTVDSSIYGEQYITYTVTDSNGNTAEAVRTIVVKETTPPELSLLGESSLFLTVGDTFTDPGYTANDNADGDISAKVSVEGNVDTNKIGVYKLTYTATDSSANSVSASRMVYVHGQNTSAAAPNGKVIYLTFDDGPGPYTEQLLDLLDKYNVKVTFFVTSQYSDYLDMIGEAHRRGHTIALHTYSHVFSDIYTSETAYYEDLHKIQAICEEQTGVTPTIVRFPGGTSNAISRNYCVGIMSGLTQSLPYNGYQYCDWNVDSMDAGGARSSEEVSRNVISCVSSFKSSIVLQHDTKQYSVEAVDEIIEWGIANGYVFMPMSEYTPMFHHPATN